MISADLLSVYVMMLLVFFRYAAVYKDPNKINYTPVVLSIGVVGFLLHFILYGATGYELAALKESLAPLALGVVLSAIMSVMGQSVFAAGAEEERHRLSSVSDDIDLLKQTLGSFSGRIEHLAQMEDTTHEQLRTVFKEEIEALTVIQANQKLFVSKIESLLAKQQLAMEKFEEFTLTEVPGLDNVVHRHIDLLRIAEQDHFNQLKNAAKVSCDEQKLVHSKLHDLEETVRRIATDPLPENTMAVLHKELDRVVHDFSRQLQAIGAKSEQMVTTLLENDAILKGSREQSELIMQQMVLSSNQMREITAHTKELSDSLKPLGKLFASAEALHQEFMDAKSALSELVVSLEHHERRDYTLIRENIERSLAAIEAKVTQMAESAVQPSPLATTADARTVQDLASRVRMQKSYMGENQE